MGVDLDLVTPALSELSEEPFIGFEVLTEVIPNRGVALVLEPFDASEVGIYVGVGLTRGEGIGERNTFAILSAEELIHRDVEGLRDGVVEGDVNPAGNLVLPRLLRERDLDGREVERALPDENRFQSLLQCREHVECGVEIDVGHFAQSGAAGIGLEKDLDVLGDGFLRVGRTGLAHLASGEDRDEGK